MLHKIKGIVLKTTNYSESSVVVQIFTNKFGIQSYLINGVKKPKAKISINVLQPLHLLDLVVYHKTNSSLQRVSELRPSPIFRSIPYDVVKSTITIFLNEVLHKSIRQQTEDEQLFAFIFNAIAWFDETEKVSVNFHLSFLMKLTRFLGFAPNEIVKPTDKYFDLQEGAFVFMPPAHPYFIEREEAEQLILLFQTSFDKINDVKLSNVKRRILLDKILIYYALHTASFGQIRSHQILEEVLS